MPPASPTGACRRGGQPLFEGPRLFISALPSRRPAATPTSGPRGVRGRDLLFLRRFGLIGAVADGVGEVRKAVRAGAPGCQPDQDLAGGGSQQPTDPIDGTQFSVEELRAAVKEAKRPTSTRWRTPIRRAR